jgi:damage-control phosphatase, subfamily III
MLKKDPDLVFFFSPKSIPWFVSDVTPPDFAALLDTSSLPRGPTPENLERTIARWNTYLANGTFSLSVPTYSAIGMPDERVNFWTSPWPYWNLRLRAPKVWNALSESGLVIFKVGSWESQPC